MKLILISCRIKSLIKLIKTLSDILEINSWKFQLIVTGRNSKSPMKKTIRNHNVSNICNFRKFLSKMQAVDRKSANSYSEMNNVDVQCCKKKIERKIDERKLFNHYFCEKSGKYFYLMAALSEHAVCHCRIINVIKTICDNEEK